VVTNEGFSRESIPHTGFVRARWRNHTATMDYLEPSAGERRDFNKRFSSSLKAFAVLFFPLDFDQHRLLLQLDI
jgi:hypothetical protein